MTYTGVAHSCGRGGGGRALGPGGREGARSAAALAAVLAAAGAGAWSPAAARRARAVAGAAAGAPWRAPRRARAACANLRVRMQPLAPPAELEATTDPCDRAHRAAGPDGRLLPATQVRGASRPREYHRQYMVGPAGARVSVETVYERTLRAQAELGLSGEANAASAVARSLDALGAAARTVARGAPVRCAMTEDELRLERAADRLLAGECPR